MAMGSVCLSAGESVRIFAFPVISCCFANLAGSNHGPLQRDAGIQNSERFDRESNSLIDQQ